MKTSSLKKCFLFAALAGTMSVCADSTVSDVTLVQEQSTRTVTITYKLTGDDAIVTVDLLKDGQSIGDEHLTTLCGDVNRLVPASETDVRTVIWHPDLDWPGQRKQPLVAKVTAWSKSAPPDYMVADLTTGELDSGTVAYYTSTNAFPKGGLTNDIYRTDKMVFRKIPAKGVTWRMGSPEGELGRYEDEAAHLVTLRKDYWFGIFSVTQGQLMRIKKWSDPSPMDAFCLFTNRSCYATRPVQGIGYMSLRSTTGVGTYLSAMRDLFGGRMLFDIPTEAQWEYAARAGKGTSLNDGHNIENVKTDEWLDKLGRYDKNDGVADLGLDTDRTIDDSKGTSKVGIYPPNAWGIYDIHGSVANWCLDWYAPFVASDAVMVDPEGPETGTKRVYRGGFWGYVTNDAASRCRLASRLSLEPNTDKLNGARFIGFRLCLEIE